MNPQDVKILENTKEWKREKVLDVPYIVKIVLGQVLNVEECRYLEHWWEGDIITRIGYIPWGQISQIGQIKIILHCILVSFLSQFEMIFRVSYIKSTCICLEFLNTCSKSLIIASTIARSKSLIYNVKEWNTAAILYFICKLAVKPFQTF